MPPSSRIPPLLQPYISLPRDDSILLLTSTLGASANWLIVRFLCDALSNRKNGGAAGTPHNTEGGGGEGANVILVSWMRDYEFWKQEARKGGGLDLDRCRKDGRLAFVDGLERLFLQSGQGVRAAQLLPLRGQPPGRAASTALPKPTSAQNLGLHTLQSADPADLKATILAALSHIQTNGRKTLLILDNPDILLATSPTPTKPLTSLPSLFLTLHTQIPHLLIHTQSDTPLLTLSTPPQPIEHAQHNFLVKLAHMSTRLLSVRVLDTGVARDVSGVLRVTENGYGIAGVGLAVEDDQESDGKESAGVEVLYKVGGNGGVRVFERGAGAGDA